MRTTAARPKSRENGAPWTWVSKSMPRENPPKRSMWCPACSTAENTTRTSVPRAAPASASPRRWPTKVAVSTGAYPGETRGAAARASARPMMSRTCPGTARWAKGGAMRRKASMRTEVSRVASTSPGSRSRTTASPAQELRDELEERLGEVHQLADHPVAGHEQGDGHGDRLGHEGEGDLLDLRHRLEDRDRQADEERRHEDGRGELGRHRQALGGDVEHHGVVHERPLRCRSR